MRGALQQALLDERCERVEADSANGGCRLDVERADEDCEPGGKRLLILRKQVEAPLERRAERLLACG